MRFAEILLTFSLLVSASVAVGEPNVHYLLYVVASYTVVYVATLTLVL